jgi:hypothetical protein
MNLPRNALGPQKVEPSDVAKTANGRFRTSKPTVAFESSFTKKDESFKWHELTQGSGSTNHNTNEALYELSVTSSTGDKAIRQSKLYIPYISGYSQTAFASVVFGNSTSGIRKRHGYFDERNGIFIEQSESDGELDIVLRSDTSGSPTVDQRIDRSNWSIDSLDGTGPSGLTLNEANIWTPAFDFSYWGTNEIRIGLVLKGQIHWVHKIDFSNNQSVPWAGNPSLPIRTEIENVSASSGDTIKQGSCSVLRDGGDSAIRSKENSAITPLSGVSVAQNGFEAALAVRPKSIFNGQPNRHSIQLTGVDMAINFEKLYYEIRYGGDITASNWTSVSNNSITEYVTQGDITGYTPGVILERGFLVKNAKATKRDIKSQKTGLIASRGIDHTNDSSSDLIVFRSYGLKASGTGWFSLNWFETK